MSPAEVPVRRRRTLAGGRLAWIAPIIIVVGTAATCGGDYVEDLAEYLLVSGGATAVAAALAKSISNGGSRATIRWVLLGVFCVAYVAQQWWMLVDPFGADWVAPRWRPVDVQAAFRWSVAGFAAAAAMLSLLDRLAHRDAVCVPTPQAGAILARRAAALAVAMLAINTPLMLLNNVGVVGTASTLPYRLGGIIQNTQRVVIPVLLLAAMYGAIQAGLSRRFWLLTCLYLGMSLFDTVVTTGKLPFIQSLIGTLMVVALSRRLTLRFLWIAAIGGIALVLIYPAFAYMRTLRSPGSGGRIGSTRTAIELSLRERSARDGFQGVVFRGVGTEVLSSIVADNARLPRGEWPLALGGGTDVAVYVTRVTFGYGANDAMGVAPSLVGWFYVGLGPEWIVPGMALFVLVIDLIWRRLAGARLVTGVPLLAYFGTMLLLICNDGTLDAQGIPLLVFGTSALAAEVLARAGGSSVPLFMGRVASR